jgi:hypothetical protein
MEEVIAKIGNDIRDEVIANASTSNHDDASNYEEVVQSTIEEAPIMILPLNVLSHIVEVSTWGWKHLTWGNNKNSPISIRLVCKRWNRAALASFAMWKRLLLEIGPSHIGPSSVHMQSRYFARKEWVCKTNAEGRCTIAFHYDSRTLEPTYTATTAIAAYQECMRILGKKRLAKKKNQMKSLDKKYLAYEEKLTDCVKRLKRDMKIVKRDRDRIEKARELDQKTYQKHLKKRKKKE